MLLEKEKEEAKTMKRANYLIHYTGHPHYPFDIYIYPDGHPLWIASVGRTRMADAIADEAYGYHT